MPWPLKTSSGSPLMPSPSARAFVLRTLLLTSSAAGFFDTARSLPPSEARRSVASAATASAASLALSDRAPRYAPPSMARLLLSLRPPRAFTTRDRSARRACTTDGAVADGDDRSAANATREAPALGIFRG